MIEAKIIIKHKKVRVYKKILKIGSGNYMPAKFDKIEYRLKDLDEESLNPRVLDEVEFEKGQMGNMLLNHRNHDRRSRANLLS